MLSLVCDWTTNLIFVHCLYDTGCSHDVFGEVALPVCEKLLVGEATSSKSILNANSKSFVKVIWSQGRGESNKNVIFLYFIGYIHSKASACTLMFCQKIDKANKQT